MRVRFLEQASGTRLWEETRNALYRGRFTTHPYVQQNSKRRAEWWISRLDDSDPNGVVIAFVEPANERAVRRMKRRMKRRNTRPS